MNTILLQKILDILREGLAHAGNFFKDLFVSDPQDGQVIGYDGDSGKWKNMDVAELSFDLTHTAGPDDIITFSDAADIPMKSLIANINAPGGTDEVVITHTGKNLFDKSKMVINTQRFVKYGVTSYSDTLPNGTLKLKANQAYTFSFSGANSTNFESFGVYNDEGTRVSVTYNNKKSTFTPASSGAYFLAFSVSSSNWGGTWDNYDIQLEANNQSTDYEAYTATTETVTLPSSVTSGYIDVISGEGMSGDTPFTVTPVIIKSDSGVNNIYADTGTVRAEYYTATAGTIKSLVCISEDITDQVTVNTDNFSDVHVKVMKNNNVVTIYLNSATAILGGQLLTGLPAPAYNMNIVVNDGSDGSPVGATLQTQGRLNVSAAASQTVNALITYVAK